MSSLLLDVITLAAMYTLLGSSFVIIYRGTGLINFAQGQFAAFGAYFAALLIGASLGSATVRSVGIFAALVGAAIIGALTYLVVIRPLTGRPMWSAIIATFGLSVFLGGVLNVLLGARSIPLSLIEPQSFLVGSPELRSHQVITVVAAITVVAGFLLIERRSRIGKRMRGAAENPLLASLSGVNLNVMFALAWALGASAAAVAGVVYGARTTVSTELVLIGLRGLVPALIGGLDSIKGLPLGALLVAVVEIVVATTLGSYYIEVGTYSLLLLFVLLRPWGFYGTPEVDRV